VFAHIFTVEKLFMNVLLLFHFHQSRLEALNQIVEMLSCRTDKSANLQTPSTAHARGLIENVKEDHPVFSSMIASVHQQFLIGCFGLGELCSDVTRNPRIHHYLVSC
jgi:hypothetical protein